MSERNIGYNLAGLSRGDFSRFRKALGDLLEHIEPTIDTQRRNLIATAMEQVTEHLSYLEITLARYKSGRERFFNEHLDEQGNMKLHRDGLDLMAELERRHEVAIVLHLDIETFYLFARILLDRIVLLNHALLGWLGSASLSHSRFKETLRAKVVDKNPSLSDLIETLERLEPFVHLRDHKVVHERSPYAIKATGFRARQDAYIVYNRLYPPPGHEQVNAPSPPVLVAMITEYLENWLQFIEQERTLQ